MRTSKEPGETHHKPQVEAREAQNFTHQNNRWTISKRKSRKPPTPGLFGPPPSGNSPKTTQIYFTTPQKKVPPRPLMAARHTDHVDKQTNFRTWKLKASSFTACGRRFWSWKTDSSGRQAHTSGGGWWLGLRGGCNAPGEEASGGVVERLVRDWRDWDFGWTDF